MSAAAGAAPSGGLATDDFDRALAADHLAGFWTARVPAHRPQPGFVWRWAPVQAALERAGREIGIEQAERRVIKLANPHLPSGAASRSVQFNFSLVNGGERAVTHRHSIGAVRFVLDGAEGYTTVDGSRCDMRPGDFILTPAGSWHDHANPGERPMVWLDGLDGPLVQALNLAFFEDHAEPVQRVERIATAPLRVAWDEAQSALQAVLPAGEDERFGAVFDYPALPTLASRMLKLRAGVPLREHRRSATAMVHVVAGSGSTWVGEERFDWSRGDTLVLPGWAWCRHQAAADGDATLFTMDDGPALRALGLLREETR